MSGLAKTNTALSQENTQKPEEECTPFYDGQLTYTISTCYPCVNRGYVVR